MQRESRDIDAPSQRSETRPALRNLTDGDVTAIVTALEKSLTDKFYSDLGRGVWSWVRKTLIAMLLAFAAYGAVKGYK